MLYEVITQLKSRYLGKTGELSGILKGLKDATPEERQSIGAKSNQFKRQMEDMVVDRIQEIELAQINESLEAKRIDISLRDSLLEKGMDKAGLHP